MHVSIRGITGRAGDLTDGASNIFPMKHAEAGKQGKLVHALVWSAACWGEHGTRSYRTLGIRVDVPHAVSTTIRPRTRCHDTR